MCRKLEKKKNCIFLLLIGIMLLCCNVSTVSASEIEEAQEITIIEIGDTDSFLELAENCRLDSFSRDLKVVLTADIDLEAEAFEGIPVFAGEFEGNGHHIKGVHIGGEGSVRGLFRYLQSTAVVANLIVEGKVNPGGTRSDVGGIAGNNAGIIRNCEFRGAVSGADYVGGIAGINEVSGIIEKCRVEGSVSGNHFLGGIVGENFGVVRSCKNSAMVNNTVEQNSIGLSDITIESLAGTESVATVTDMGGIAGSSSGVLRNCYNYKQVGYRQMGYNVGGIVGSQVGYVVDCMNYGDVYGRKEVGGLVGHQEPNVTLIYDVDTFQTLGEQLDTMEQLTSKTTSNAQSGMNRLNSQINTMNGYAKDARDAITELEQMYQDETADPDSIIAHQNHLGESLKGMASTMQGITATTKNTVNTLNKNVQAINKQMDAINATLDNAEDGLGGEVVDVSDADTEELTSSEIFCGVNFGRIEGDLNVGGIVGVIALETDLDSEEDVDILGEISANFVSEMRSVVLECKNWGIINVRKQYGGGIVGRQDLGLVKCCINVGNVDGEAADYVGGIAGMSMSYIRTCSVKCTIKGKNRVGGIAGMGTIASDCRSMTDILGGVEMLGAVFGMAESDIKDEEVPITGNYYVSVGADMGAIDGISYADCAQAMRREEFLRLENLPDEFRVVTVSFWDEGAVVKCLTLEVGQELLAEQIPDVPEKNGTIGSWKGLNETDLSEIAFDLCFEAAYTSNFATLQSEETNENGKPILLVLGEFSPERMLHVTERNGNFTGRDGKTKVKMWEYALDGTGEISEVRFLTPATFVGNKTKLWICNGLGVWREGACRADGSYLVFAVNEDDVAFALEEDIAKSYAYLWGVAGCSVAFLSLLVFGGIRIIKKRKKTQAET